MNRILITLFLFMISAVGYTQVDSLTSNYSTKEISVDGILNPEEYIDITTVSIQRIPEWNTLIHVQHNDDYLMITFEQLASQGGATTHPEILIQTTTAKNNTWNDQTYWFHASYGLCDSKGTYYDWDGCSSKKTSWYANRFPFKNNNNNIEFKIKWSALGVSPLDEIKIAFKTNNTLDEILFWPKTATIEQPATWAKLQFNNK